MNKKLIANIIHTLFLIALVVRVWVKVHWSVAVFCAWLSLSVYVLVSMQIRLHREYIRKLKQVREEGQQTVREFNAFVDTINQQAEKVKTATKLLKITPASVANVPKFQPCTLCVTEGNKGTEFKNGNCPIHN